MNELRWILIGFGVALLAAIYLWGRRGVRPVVSDDAIVRVRPDPALNSPEAASSGARAPEADYGEADYGVSEPMITAIRSAAPTIERKVTQDDADMRTYERPREGDTWQRGRVEPTFVDAGVTVELPARPARPESDSPAPTLSSSEAPQSRRIERRKILALRLATSPQRVEGAKLLEALQAESLQHGKYDIFHRLHEDGATIVFSVASMVEPGTFDLEKMASMQFPGVTLFAQLPGAMPGMHTLNELVACARKLQQALGGTLQDDRGVPLTVHRIERLRQEVREFERPPGASSRTTPTVST